MVGEQLQIGRALSLRGRCSRATFWVFQVIFAGFDLAAFLIWATGGLVFWPAIVVLVLASFVLSWVVFIRRLHDVGLSGWFLLVCIIPVVGWIFVWSLLFKRGQVGPNRFADDPLTLLAPRPSRPAQEWTVAVLGGLALAIAIVGFRTFAFQPFVNPSESMEPSLILNEYVVVSKFAYGFSKYSFPLSPPLFHGRLFNRSPRRGDVVVFKLTPDPNVEYVKRIVGLPGDRIQINSGVVFVNSRAMDRKHATPDGTIRMSEGDTTDTYRETTPEGRSYLTNAIKGSTQADNTGVYLVPPHCYFVLGDNRDNSLDSRFDPDMASQPTGPSYCGWDASIDAYVPADRGSGFVPEENLVGRAVLVATLADKPRFRWMDGR